MFARFLTVIVRIHNYLIYILFNFLLELLVLLEPI